MGLNIPSKPFIFSTKPKLRIWSKRRMFWSYILEQTNKLCERCLPSVVGDSATYAGAKMALTQLNSSNRPFDRRPFNYFYSNTQLQKSFTDASQAAVDWQWVQFHLTAGLKTAMSTRYFSEGFKCFCQNPLCLKFEPHFQVPDVRKPWKYTAINSSTEDTALSE